MNYKNLTKLEDKMWESFCLESQELNEKDIVTKRFQSHPKEIDSDTSGSSLEQIHWNKNFNRVESQQEFENFGIIELNNNDLLSDLKEIENNAQRVRVVEEEPEEKKPVVRVARVVSSKKLMKTNSNEKVTRKIEKAPDAVNQRNKSRPLDRKLVDEKLKTIIEKILCSIDEIRLTMESNEILPDGDEDLLRRKKRAKEFSGRFSRMYLYQIGRHLGDLQRISKMSGRSSYRAYNFDFQQKLLTIHQLTMQGFQAYQNHLPTSIPQGIPEKLKELLNNSISLCDVHRNLINCDINLVANRSQMIDIFENHCKTLLEKMQEKLQSLSLMSLNSKPSVTSNKKNVQANVQNKRKLQSRLSMYNQGISLNTSERFWRKTIMNLSKKKFNVQSRYKTATLKHRPPPMKMLNDSTKPIKLDQQQFSETVKVSKSRQSNNDDIQTMIQMECDVPKGEDEEENAMQTREMLDIRNDILKPLTRSIFEQFCDENKDMTQNEFEILLQKLLILVRNNDQNNINKNLDVVDNVKIKTDNDFVQNVPEVMHQQMNRNDSQKENRKEIKNAKDLNKKKQRITISGVKNAQLICIRDDRSIIEDTPINVEEKLTKPETSVCVCETQTDVANLIESSIKLNDNFSSKTSVKISRLPKKSLKNLDMLPKDVALNVIQYKLDFGNVNKKNHMYKKSDKIQPWILTGEIADNILRDVLLSVVREIEINEILENLYQSEFL